MVLDYATFMDSFAVIFVALTLRFVQRVCDFRFLFLIVFLFLYIISYLFLYLICYFIHRKMYVLLKNALTHVRDSLRDRFREKFIQPLFGYLVFFQKTNTP